MNNAYDNSSSLRIDRSLIEEVQVISGTFDAEYGQAMSGVVNAVLRRGTDQFHWDAEVFTGGFVYSGDRRQRRARRSTSCGPAGTQNYQASLSGPRRTAQDLLPPERPALRLRRLPERRRGVFRPTDRSDLDQRSFRPTGDGEAGAAGLQPRVVGRGQAHEPLAPATSS